MHSVSVVDVMLCFVHVCVCINNGGKMYRSIQLAAAVSFVAEITKFFLFM